MRLLSLRLSSISLAIVGMLGLFELSATNARPTQETDEVTSATAMLGVNPQRTRVYDSPALLQPRSLIWKTGRLFVTHRAYPTIYTLEGPGNPSWVELTPSGHAYSELIVARGTIYFSLYINDGYVYAQYSDSGKDRWRVKMKGVRLSPVAFANNVIYVGASDGTFYALDAATGQERWKNKQKGRSFYTAAPLVAGGIVYFSSTESLFGSNARPDGRVFAFDAKTGDKLWIFKTKGTMAAPAYGGKTLFVGDNDGYFRALDAETGQERWKVKISGGGTRQPIVKDQFVYFASYDGSLHAVEAQLGKERWSINEPKAATMLALYDGGIYYGGAKNSLYAIDLTTGQLKWKYKTGQQCKSPVLAGGVLYFPSYDGVLYALDAATGLEKWKVNDINKELSSPVLVGGLMYFLDADGHLYALK